MNVVTACQSCNHRKGNRTPEQAKMPLLYTPYIPSLWEDFILRNRRILADQMEFLLAHVPKSSRLVAVVFDRSGRQLTTASSWGTDKSSPQPSCPSPTGCGFAVERLFCLGRWLFNYLKALRSWQGISSVLA
jgi:hypothetical protein